MLSYFQILAYIPSILNLLNLLAPIFVRQGPKQINYTAIVAEVFKILRPFVPNVRNLDDAEVREITHDVEQLLVKVARDLSD